jgi:transposase
MPTKPITIMHEHAAGIDIGSDEVYVSVDGDTVKCFRTFTRSYRELLKYLRQHGITTVCMEATGVYWVSLYDLLEAAKIEVYVVNGAHVKTVGRRKSDVQDCRWLQQLHSHGLLKASFIPPEPIRQLRTYVRLRDDHIKQAAMHIQHMQKAFDQMNIRLHRVISSLTGASGLRMIEAILTGERQPEVLLALCESSIRERKGEEVLASLEGTYREDQLFALRQAYECWKFYQEQMRACEKQIEVLLQEITADLPEPLKIGKARKTRHREPEIEGLHTMLLKMTGGRDATAISGIVDQSLLRLISETGTDMRAWPTVKHFTSWLRLAPDPKQSGRMLKHAHGMHQTRAGQLFRMIAQAVATGKHLGWVGFYRRLRGRKGPKVAIKALARKIAEMYYLVLKNGWEYVEAGIEAYEQQQIAYRRKQVERLARQLNLQVVPMG